MEALSNGFCQNFSGGLNPLLKSLNLRGNNEVITSTLTTFQKYIYSSNGYIKDKTNLGVRWMTDKVLVGSLAGMFGALVSAILAFALNSLKITSIKMFFFDSVIFLPNNAATTLIGSIYGFVIHLFIGGIIGVIFAYFLPYTGDDYLIYKGIFLGAISWLFIGGVLGTMLRLPIKDTLFDNAVYFILNIIFGVATVLVVNYLRKKTVSN